jgi:anti-anti-sigma factor
MDSAQTFVEPPRQDQERLRVEVCQRDGNDVRVAVEGELDRVSAPGLADCLNGLLVVDPPPATLSISLAGVGFIDVGGLGLLLDVSQRGADCGCSVRVTECSRRALRLLRLAAEAGDAVNLVSPA